MIRNCQQPESIQNSMVHPIDSIGKKKWIESDVEIKWLKRTEQHIEGIQLTLRDIRQRDIYSAFYNRHNDLSAGVQERFNLVTPAHYAVSQPKVVVQQPPFKSTYSYVQWYYAEWPKFKVIFQDSMTQAVDEVEATDHVESLRFQQQKYFCAHGGMHYYCCCNAI